MTPTRIGTAAFAQAFADGIAWGDAKQALFERLDREIAPVREVYDEADRIMTPLLGKPLSGEEVDETGRRVAPLFSRYIRAIVREM